MKSHITEKQCHKRAFHNGFTILELLVSITIVGILTAIILPAVQQAREAGRKLSCKNRLHQIGIAIHDYEGQFGIVPPGLGKEFGWLVAILPQMEQSNLFNKTDFSKGIWAPENKFLHGTFISSYSCPSDSEALYARDGKIHLASYAANFGSGVQKFGYNGVFQYINTIRINKPAGRVRFADITDGLSNTAAVSEVLVGDGSGDLLRTQWDTPKRLAEPDQLDEFASHCASVGSSWVGDPVSIGGSWVNGQPGRTWYNHVNSPNKPSCWNKNDVQNGCYPAASLHNGGVNVLFADGHVQFISEIIDLKMWRAVGSRNGAENIRFK